MRTGKHGLMAGLCAVAVAGAITLAPAIAAEDFAGLGGSWGGGGTVKYTDGSTERMHCSAHYNGGGSDVSLSIRCASSAHNIDLTGRLHSSGGHVGGSWSESNFGLSGSASGKASAGHISLGLGGGVSGSMSVSFTPSHQDVFISVGGSVFQSVSMNLSKH